MDRFALSGRSQAQHVVADKELSKAPVLHRAGEKRFDTLAGIEPL
jgi:hypothetical protein